MFTDEVDRIHPASAKPPLSGESRNLSSYREGVGSTRALISSRRTRTDQTIGAHHALDPSTRSAEKNMGRGWNRALPGGFHRPFGGKSRRRLLSTTMTVLPSCAATPRDSGTFEDTTDRPAITSMVPSERTRF